MPYKNKNDYNKFMREYMKELRKRERELLRKIRAQGFSTKIRTRKRRRKK